ncbi:DNA replication protein psf1 [Batrachochytrium dendrobatidis]|nr:DNA replication protein psf1 [Batrachochytrium dendrobatidis]
MKDSTCKDGGKQSSKRDSTRVSTHTTSTDQISTKCYGETALKLVKEALAIFESTIQGLRPKDVSVKPLAAIVPLETACTLHTLALARNKRCVLAYQRQRLDRLVEMLWNAPGGASTASTLSDQVTQCMSGHEAQFVNGYKTLASEFRGYFLDLDLGMGLIPPNAVFVEIRVIRDCGEIATDDGTLRLDPGAQLFVRRCDVEDFILSGDVKEIVS